MSRLALDILIISLGTTPGLRRSDAKLAEELENVGVGCEVVRVGLGPVRHLRRAPPVTDLIEAYSARRTAASALLRIGGPARRHRTGRPPAYLRAGRPRPRAVIFSTVTAAFLQPAWVWRDYRTAIRFDCPAALNRRGPYNVLQRWLERRAFERADLLIPLGRAAAEAAGLSGDLFLPIPIDSPPAGGNGPSSESGIPPAGVDALHAEDGIQPEGGRGQASRGNDSSTDGESISAEGIGTSAEAGSSEGRPRSSLAVAYSGYPRKRGLDLLCRAWAEAAIPDARLVVTGVDRKRALDYLGRCGVTEPDSVEWAGMLAPRELAELLAGARAFVNASRWEDYGMAQLEALAAGTLLVTVPTPGPYEALPIVRRLAPQLVADELTPKALAAALRAAYAMSDQAVSKYRAEAEAALEPYRPESVRERLTRDILPRLLGE